MNETNTASASYIVQFFKDVQTLKYAYASYVNIIQELELKYNQLDIKNFEYAEKTIFLNTLQTLKTYIHSIDIDYHHLKLTLKQKIIEEEGSTLEDTYKELNKQFVYSKDLVKKYIVQLLAILFKDVIKDLLQNSQDILDQVYKNTDTAKNG